jgi:hypothetical protein
MKALTALLLLIVGLAAPAAAGDYTLANRPEVIFPGPNGGTVRVSPYPAGTRAAAVWASDACWRDCKSNCAWKMESCVSVMAADTCRPHLDACDRSCQRSCRSRGGPLLGFIDW